MGDYCVVVFAIEKPLLGYTIFNFKVSYHLKQTIELSLIRPQQALFSIV